MEEEIKDCFLTITVITYNSEAFIDETLESISQQCSLDIQIILADDASTDNTLFKLKNWKTRNEVNFNEILLLESKKNRGIIENYRRTFDNTKGIWLKAIAGDDLFYRTAIKSMRSDANKNPKNPIIIGKAKLFGNQINKDVILPKHERIKNLKTINQCKKYIFEGKIFPGVSFMIQTKVLREIDVFKYAKGQIEDIPFQLELLTNGYHFKFSEHIYIKYRQHEKSVSSKHDYETLSKIYLEYQRILLTYAFRNIKVIYILNASWNLFFGQIIFLLGNKGAFCSLIEKIKRKLQPKRFFNMISRGYRAN